MSDSKLARESHDPAVLARLGRDGSARIKRLVARNPSAPWEVLRELLAHYSEHVIENPSLPLLLMADPGLFQRMLNESLVGLARVHRRLGELLGWTEEPPWTELQLTLRCIAAAGDKGSSRGRYRQRLGDVRLSLVQRVTLPLDIQALLVRDPDRRVRDGLATRTRSHEIQEALIDDPERHPALVRNDHLHAAMKWALAQSGAAAIRMYLASHAKSSKELLAHLAGDDEFEVRSAVARNRETPDAIRKKLAWDGDRRVCIAARQIAVTRIIPPGARR